jgi:hypothetical protein
LAWAFTSNISLISWDFNARFARFLPDLMLYKGELSLPWQMIFYLAVGLLIAAFIWIIKLDPQRYALLSAQHAVQLDAFICCDVSVT